MHVVWRFISIFAPAYSLRVLFVWGESVGMRLIIDNKIRSIKSNIVDYDYSSNQRG